MTEEQLNKKLAEWAGLSLKHDFKPIGFDNMVECSKCGIGKPPLFKYCCLPNFTQSLGACFKWLVPIAIDNLAGSDCLVNDARQNILDMWLGEAKNKELNALALCKAIEKLIDGG